MIPAEVVIKTDEPDQPSKPLFFRVAQTEVEGGKYVDHVTTSCLYLEWDPPQYDGGSSEIIDYKIYYSVFEKKVTATSRDFVVERHLNYNAGPVCHCVIRNIMSDIRISKISVKAISKVGLSSDRADLNRC